MLEKTRGIVLKSVKYGESSLITHVFTELYGLQSYMVKGIRGSKKQQSRSGLFQPASILDFIADHKPQRGLQYIREYQPFYIYSSLSEHIAKSSIAIFCAELLQKLIPEHEPFPQLFEFTVNFLISLDSDQGGNVGNMPLFFMLQCGRFTGYNIAGTYSGQTPYLNAQEGMFTSTPPPPGNSLLLSREDVAAFALICNVKDVQLAAGIPMNAPMRNRLMDWYIEFLQLHTQHLGQLKSPDILRTILH